MDLQGFKLVFEQIKQKEVCVQHKLCRGQQCDTVRGRVIVHSSLCKVRLTFLCLRGLRGQCTCLFCLHKVAAGTRYLPLAS